MTDFPRSVEEIASDYATRRAGMLRALTDGEHPCTWLRLALWWSSTAELEAADV
jgi:hypothetical protein